MVEMSPGYNREEAYFAEETARLLRELKVRTPEPAGLETLNMPQSGAAQSVVQHPSCSDEK